MRNFTKAARMKHKRFNSCAYDTRIFCMCMVIEKLHAKGTIPFLIIVYINF